MPGAVFAPFHYGYWDQRDDVDDRRSRRAANELTISDWDPVSKQPTFKVAAVRLTPIATEPRDTAPAITGLRTGLHVSP